MIKSKIKTINIILNKNVYTGFYKFHDGDETGVVTGIFKDCESMIAMTEIVIKPMMKTKLLSEDLIINVTIQKGFEDDDSSVLKTVIYVFHFMLGSKIRYSLSLPFNQKAREKLAHNIKPNFFNYRFRYFIDVPEYDLED